MSLSPKKQVTCTVCDARFEMVYGAMIHPADTVCSPCILQLWDAPPAPAALATRLRMRMGMGPDILASAILDRVERLRDLVADRDELVATLARRAELR